MVIAENLRNTFKLCLKFLVLNAFAFLHVYVLNDITRLIKLQCSNAMFCKIAFLASIFISVFMSKTGFNEVYTVYLLSVVIKLKQLFVYF